MTDQPDPHTTTPAEAGAVLAGIGAVITWAWAISAHWPLWLTALTVFVCAPLAGIGIYAGLGRANRGRRLRIRYQHHPRPALVLTDTPRPTCPHCRGAGWWTEYVQDGPDPEDGEGLDVPCDCWTDWWRTLLPLPHRLAAVLNRPATTGYSDEPPF